MWTFLKKLVSRPEPLSFTIVADDERIVIARSDRAGPVTFLWRDVEEIDTHKIDVFSCDDVRLAFRVGGRIYEVREDNAGFGPLAERMRAVFPSIPADWYHVVMFPAFETNRRTLWKRD